MPRSSASLSVTSLASLESLPAPTERDEAVTVTLSLVTNSRVSAHRVGPALI